MNPNWSLPDFVGMTVYGGDCLYQADLAAIAGVLYVRRMSSLNSLAWEYYVAADPLSWGQVARQIADLPGVDRVEATSLTHKQKD